MSFPKSWITCSLILLAFLADIEGASAFKRCDSLLTEGQSLASIVGYRVAYDAPIEHLAVALSIEFVDTDKPDTLVPKATIDSNGRRQIVFPTRFETVACQIILAHFLENEDFEGVWQDAYAEGRRCFQDGSTYPVCMIRFGASLQKSLEETFSKLPIQNKNTAYAIARDAIFQIGAHELAHHLLEHHRRVESGRTLRVDVEFEADFYAILWAIADGRAYSALAYLFRGLEILENAAGLRSPPTHYESSACRTHNVERSISALSQSPFLFRFVVANRRAVDGIGRPLDVVLKFAIDDLKSAPPVKHAPEACSRLSQTVLTEARSEMLALMQTYYSLGKYFIVTPEEGSATFPALARNTPLEALKTMANSMRQSQHLGVMASGVMSHVLQRAGHTQGIQLSKNLVKNLRKDIARYSSGRNYGRFLNALGTEYLASLDVVAERRLAKELYEESARYLPDSTDTWANLGLIAMYDRDCKKGISYTELALKFANEGGPKDMANSNLAFFRRIPIEQPEKCDTFP